MVKEEVLQFRKGYKIRLASLLKAKSKYKQVTILEIIEKQILILSKQDIKGKYITAYDAERYARLEVKKKALIKRWDKVLKAQAK
jgi:hypothetical protein